MKVFEHQKSDIKENKVEIYYNKKDEEIVALLDYLNGVYHIIGKTDTYSMVISPQEIYYFEAVDRKYFVYLRDRVYQVVLNLQQIEARLGEIGFVRINKSVIVNLRKVRCLKAGLNMRMTAELLNGENLMINRSYKIPVRKAIEKLYRGIQNEDY